MRRKVESIQSDVHPKRPGWFFYFLCCGHVVDGRRKIKRKGRFYHPITITCHHCVKSVFSTRTAKTSTHITKNIAFDEWRLKLRLDDRTPRGQFFKRKMKEAMYSAGLEQKIEKGVAEFLERFEAWKDSTLD